METFNTQLMMMMTIPTDILIPKMVLRNFYLCLSSDPVFVVAFFLVSKLLKVIATKSGQGVIVIGVDGLSVTSKLSRLKTSAVLDFAWNWFCATLFGMNGTTQVNPYRQFSINNCR